MTKAAGNSEFLEIKTKIIGSCILGIIAVFVTFTLMMPAFSALTIKLFISDYYPSSLIEFTKSTVILWVNDAFMILGQTQVPICLVIVIPYWIIRATICKFTPKYARKILADIIVFFVVFALSEYLIWTTYMSIENFQTYSITNLPNSILIGMTASILKDLLIELSEK